MTAHEAVRWRPFVKRGQARRADIRLAPGGRQQGLNLAYRWFCRLGLDGEVPDHSTFSKNRHGRFRESDLLDLPWESGELF